MSNPTDLIERLELGSGTSPDHFLMIEAAAELRRLHEVNQELIEALRAMVIAHPIPSTVCKDRQAYEQAREAIAKAEGEQA